MEMIWKAFEIFTIFFENAAVYYFIQKHFPGKFSGKTNKLAGAAAVIIITLIYTVFLNDPFPWLIDGFGFIFFWLSYTVLFRKGYIYEKCFWSVFLSCITIICTVIVITWAMFITGASQNTIIFERGAFRLLLIIVSKSMQFFTCLYFSKIYIVSPEMRNGLYITQLAILSLCFFIDITLMNIGNIIGYDSFLSVYLAISAACVLAFLMITYYLYYRISSQHILLLKAQGELQFKSMLTQHNEELIKVDSNMRVWRHDIHNHLQSLAVLARTENNSEIEDYIYRLGHQLGDFDGVCNTGNAALDAIVSAKHSIAQIDEITVDIHTMPIARIPLVDLDLTSLLGNLFDNAIEACRRVDNKKRSIDLFLGMMGSMVCIKMINTTDGRELKENNKFLTIKTSNGLHGLGLNNIDRITYAANGLVERSHENNLFTTVLLFPVV